MGVIIGLGLGLAALAAAAAWAAGAVLGQNRLAPPARGTAGTLVGATGVVRDIDGPVLQVLVEGARWRAVADRPLAIGTAVTVQGQDGLTLLVAPTGG